jgi:hypothetical protein
VAGDNFMAEETVKETKHMNKWGLSKKTNIAIAGIAGIGAAQASFHAVVCITIIVLVCVTYQFILDWLYHIDEVKK